MVKKINPQDMTVEEKLKALYQLQTIYTEIDKIKTLRGELPLEVQDLEDEIAGLQTRVNNFQTDYNTMKSADTEYRRTIEKAQALVDKYTKDLDNVRNNREYESLQAKVEADKAALKATPEELTLLTRTRIWRDSIRTQFETLGAKIHYIRQRQKVIEK